MSRPAGDRLGEIDVEHDTPEIEQKRIRAAGGEVGHCVLSAQ
jgi:hypothetical protein